MNNTSISFLEDFYPQELFAVTIRSNAASGEITGLHIPPSMPSTYTVVNSSNIPGTNSLYAFETPILADGKVSYKGEPAAILIGPDLLKLSQYAKQCGVIVNETSETDAKILAKRRLVYTPPKDSPPPPAEIKKIQGVYSTGIQEHWYAEPNGAAAQFIPDTGSFVIDTTSQWPYHVKLSVAQVLGVPLERVCVTSRRLGVHLDGKLWYPSLIACQAALCAFISGKIVKLMLTHEEDFRFSPKRNASEITVKTNVDTKTGGILNTYINASLDLGNRPCFVDEIADNTCLGAAGLYNYDSLNINLTALESSKPPQGPCAGFGLSQGFFAIERHASHIADAMKQDPAKWRKDHILKRGSSLLKGAQTIEEQPVEKLIDMAANMSDYYRKWAAYELLRGKNDMFRGIGISTAYQGTGLLHEKEGQSVTVSLRADGSVHIQVCAIDYAGISLWKYVAAQALSIDPALVRIKSDVDCAPLCGIAVVASLIEQACKEIKTRALTEKTPITVNCVQKPKSASVPKWKNNSFDSISYCACVIEVEIDSITYIPIIRGIYLTIEGGHIISEKQLTTLLKMHSIHALGWTCKEYLKYIDGKLPDTLVYRYAIASPGEIPPIQVKFLKTEDASPKDVGNLPFSTIPAAYAQAVSQAMDYPFDSIPITAEDVWEASLTKTSRREAGH